MRQSNHTFSFAYVYIASYLMLVNALPFVKAADILGLAAAFLLPSFAVYMHTNTAKKALAAGFCTAGSAMLYQNYSGHYTGLLFAVLAAGLCTWIFRKVKTAYGFAALLVIGFSITVGAGLLVPVLSEALIRFAGVMEGKGALFGVVHSFWDMAFSDAFGDLFYHKAFGGTAVTAAGVQSGAMHVADSHFVAQYLTGKYFVNIFVTVGVLLCLLPRLQGRVKTAFCFLCALAAVFGDARLLSLFLLLNNPVVYTGYLSVAFVAYLVPSLLDLRIPFYTNGSLWELAQYGNHWIYFMLTGIVLTALSYFAARTALAFYSPEKEPYYPRRVRELLRALGGVDNIEQIGEKCLTVHNPNLINVLLVDCEIHQNVVTLFDDDLTLLQKYLL